MKRTRWFLFFWSYLLVLVIQQTYFKETKNFWIRTNDLPNNRRTLYPLSYGEPHGERGHVLGSYLTRFLHTAWISNVDVLLCDERMKDHGCSWGGGGAFWGAHDPRLVGLLLANNLQYSGGENVMTISWQEKRFFVKYFRQRLLSLVNMGLHAAIIRLSPLIH